MKLQRPPFVLAHVADLAGCGFHRIIRPLQILGRNGILTGRAEQNFVPDQVLTAIRPDVVIWQRQIDDGSIEHMKRYRAALPDAFFVYELDDALGAVPDKSWHRPYMTPNIDLKTRAAVAMCDVVTVTTQDLADHMRSICEPGTKVRIVPNMLGMDDFEQALQIRIQAADLTAKYRAEHPSETRNRLKVGWGGGIGHAGDLELLHGAMTALKDEVDWVFLGMNPEVPDGVSKFHAGTANPDRYLASLAAIDVDLIVAPLEENLFNRCKSNLRLIEAGACSYPVIASPVAPYLTDSPPITYANNTNEWIKAIRDFIALPDDKRKAAGKRMYDWANSRYNMDSHAETRLLGWLPNNTRPFKPKLHVKGSGIKIIRTAELAQGAAEGISLDLINACETTTNDVLYIRGDVEFSDEAIARLRACDGDVVIPLSNDAGPWGFPSQQQFTPFDPGVVTKLDELCKESFDSALIPLAAVAGPVVLMKRSALAAIGSPDFEHFAPEVSLIDWASAARSRGLKVGIAANCFAGVRRPRNTTHEEVQLATLRVTGRWPQGQNDDAKLRGVREKLELVFHRDHYTKIPPKNRGDYNAWVAQCDTRGEKAESLAREWRKSKSNSTNIHGIAYPIARIELESFGNDQWFMFFPNHGVLAEQFDCFLMDSINENPDARIIYGDHDHILASGQRVSPDFKPNLDIHMLLSRDYVSQAVAIRADFLRELLPTDAFMLDEASIYRFVLLALATTGRNIVKHCPRILAHIPPQLLTEAEAVKESKLSAARSYIAALGWNIDIVEQENVPVIRRLIYSARLDRLHESKPKVSIIIPCKDNFEMFAPCIATIDSMTEYPNYEVIVMSNDTTRPEMLDLFSVLQTRPNFKIVKFDEPFNWAKVNNVAVREHASGDYLCFLNDDTRVLSRTWLNDLVGAASMPEIGAAGARLVYPHGLIQHVGVVCHKATTGHIHKGLPVNSTGTNFYPVTSHEATAVTGACMVSRREAFESVNGFDELFPHNFNDVVYCIELYKRGLLSVLVNNAELQHFEGVTRNPINAQERAHERLERDSRRLIELYNMPDPYWNPNLVVATLHGGHMIAGMDLATFEFPAPPPPWGEPSPDRVIVFGNLECATPEMQDGAIIVGVSVHGTLATISTPPMVNCGPWDIRQDMFINVVNSMAITKIVLGDLGEMPMQLLSMIRRLGIPVIYRPMTAESVCMRGDLKTPKGSCFEGYLRGACQGCVDEFSSPRGAPSHIGWMAEWLRFFSDSMNVELDLSLLSPEYATAIDAVYNQARAACDTQKPSTQESESA